MQRKISEKQNRNLLFKCLKACLKARRFRIALEDDYTVFFLPGMFTYQPKITGYCCKLWEPEVRPHSMIRSESGYHLPLSYDYTMRLIGYDSVQTR